VEEIGPAKTTNIFNIAGGMCMETKIDQYKLDKLLTQINDVRDILNEISHTYDKRNERSIELRLKVSKYLDELIADYMIEIRKGRDEIFIVSEDIDI
jgi:hypothetical protein